MDVMNIGIIATPQSYIEQEKILKKCNLAYLKIKNKEELEGIDGLVICSEDIFSLNKIIDELNIYENIIEKVRNDFPIIAISAALQILSKDYQGGPSLGVFDIKIKIEKRVREEDKTEYFEIPLIIPILGKKSFKGVFSKNFYISKVRPNIGILSQIDSEKIVFVRQGNFLGTVFHPELADDIRVHKYFFQIIRDYKNKN